MTILDRMDDILQPAHGEIVQELRHELKMRNALFVGDPEQIKPTHDNLLLVLRRRKDAAERAHIEPRGFEYVIQQLENASPTLKITVLHFEATAKMFSLFLDSSKDEVIGCISIVRRENDKPISSWIGKPKKD